MYARETRLLIIFTYIEILPNFAEKIIKETFSNIVTYL